MRSRITCQCIRKNVSPSRFYCLSIYIAAYYPYNFLITTTEMIDHIIGRPSPSWKRAQVSFVVVFFITIISAISGISCHNLLGVADRWRKPRSSKDFVAYQIEQDTS
jgi:hypothetical protein